MSGKVYVLVVAAISSILLRVEGFHSISFFFLLALIYFFYKYKSDYKLLISALILIVLFYVNPLYFKDTPPKPNTNILAGKITSIPDHDGNKTSFELKSNDRQTYQVNYFARDSNENNDLKNLRYGMVCQIQGEYKLPPEPRNFYSFNYKEYLKTVRKIYYQFTPDSFSLEDCRQGSVTPYSLLQNYRQNGINYIMENFPEGSRGVVIALVFGDRGEIGHEILESYQSLGIIHLLAVSGLHVGLVSASLYFLFIRLGVTKERAIDLLLIMLPIYAVLAGGAPSVLRATAMSMVVLLSLRAHLKLNPLDGISYVCLLLLVFNPSYIFHLGFQLSFLVSYSLIISANTLLNRYSSWVIQLLVVTLVAQFVSFPIIVYNFYEISLWSIPLNLIYIPFVTFFALPLSFVVFISHFIFPLFSESLLIIFDFVIVNAHRGLAYVMTFPFSTLTFGKPPLIIVVFYYLAIGLNLYVWEKSPSIGQLIKSSSIFLVVALFHWHIHYITNEGVITMIDVGQGDSIYIELPRREAVYLIDTGGLVDFRLNDWSTRTKTFDVGNDVLLPYLKAKGVRKIDKLILTHGHFDHIGGAEALIGEIPVEKILYGIGPVEGVFEQQLLRDFYNEGTEIEFVQKGYYWKRGDFNFQVLAPVGGEQTLNDRSIVVYTKIGGLYWLFTGDLEAPGERRFLNNFNAIEVDVLKVGHHGSNTSTTEPFLEFVDPSFALIPVGRTNYYGHPHPDVIGRLEANDIKIFRTDHHGAIRYRFKNDVGHFETLINERTVPKQSVRHR
ncbi:DNA internalization-related competence protein ComEC/Rec2 [Anaerobacillus arseniciselenatis]|uniref:DNA internalization-related competence protein ComEC/Rec2 n=1 Tax=Anaerobacillus arseniciselenatis TaxID=85682 RepID=A0A1S2LVE2_9BACI|nr:DNA internalization-related competence protein ComEC/Rec2 [Anaerobacillus arseniciselenatis]OIJ16170.1 DNA internalization-related competence protein ComEC/Rec2 [Anaerobacillus arseniciselenatis]